MWEISKADLPFELGSRGCDRSTMGDGICDAVNNDMGCGFDDGDCCRLSVANHSLSSKYHCKSPVGVSKLAPWVKGFELHMGNEFNKLDEEKASTPSVPQLWPFQTTNGDFTYPFNMREAMMEVLEAQESRYTGDFTVLPSLACPDCWPYAGDYMAVPFFVDADPPDYPLFPNLTGTRERTFKDKFRVVGGVLLTQERSEPAPGPVRFYLDPE